MSEMATGLEPRTFTVEEYHRMAEIGIIEAGERIELLDGQVVRMSPVGVPHWVAHSRLLQFLFSRLAGLALVAVDISIPLGECNEPQPDIAILAKLEYGRLDRAPAPAEIYALIELSDSSIARDTRTKRRLYARFGIADYLVVDLNANELIHFSHPSGDDYPEPPRLHRGETFRLATFPGIELPADPFLADR